MAESRAAILWCTESAAVILGAARAMIPCPNPTPTIPNSFALRKPVWHRMRNTVRGILLDEQDEIHPLFHGAPATPEFQKLRKRLVREVREVFDT